MHNNKKNVKEIILRVFPDILENEIKITPLGGMTNKNHLVLINEKKYVIRIPGEMTSSLISRQNEKYNSELMSKLAVNVNTKYFNEKSGVKVTEYLEESLSLTHNNISDDNFLKAIAYELYNCHNSKTIFNNEFNIFEKFSYYLSLLKDKDRFFMYNNKINDIHLFFSQLNNNLTKYPLSPCHNDLVPENILIKGSKAFFIDWEYSGMNHYLFDIAAFFLEARLSIEDQIKFLEYYNPNLNYKEIKKDILTHQFTQDVLWFLWTLIKEENNEFFGNYAETRINRAYKTMKKIIDFNYG